MLSNDAFKTKYQSIFPCTFIEFITICKVIYLSNCAHWVQNKLSEHSHSITKHISKHDNKYKDIPKF